jgi:NADPH:quinone reductase-like Zn-dependent oxidoreductase/acyl carrier protein
MVRRGDRFAVRGTGEIAVDPEVSENYQALFQALRDRGCGLDAIVFLWPVDCDILPDATTTQLEAQLRDSCEPLLNLNRALSHATGGAGSTLWVATRSAQSVVEGDKVDGLFQTGILGIVRTAAHELPEIACRCFDLQSDGDVGALIDELSGPCREPLVAIRGGRRYVARLIRDADMAAADNGGGPRQLELVERGGVEGLALRPQQRAQLGDSDVEIQVRAAGLNFRDVLNVLGAREDAAELGGEVAGLISRVGAAVTGLEIGQPVVAVTSGGLGDYAVAGADLVLEKPERLSFEEAASSPLAFLTAHYALNVIGKMAAGERILIHAAAGGVGMAAAQLALRAGLDVFATAGSAEKRDYLRTIGIGRVFDSRSLDFADGVARETGGEGVDLVIGAVTGPAIAAGLRLLRPGGRFLEIGKAEILSRADIERINPDARYHAIDLAELIAREPLAVRPMFADLMARLAADTLQPLPVATFALDDARQAFAHMARARHIGKVVLAVGRAGPGLGRQSAVPLRSDATYLITGGLTGLGLATADRLAERGARSIVLVGRRPPDENTSIAIERMRRKGARIVAVQADVSSEAEVRRLFEGALRDAPPLRGVIHAAGVLADAGLMQQSWSRFAAALAPKAYGAWVLHRLTADVPLDFFVLFSSASALLGAPGQSNHAAANAFLDGLAHYRRARGLPALSINWGAWSDIGAAAARNVAQRIGTRGVGELSVDEGLGALERLLGQSTAQVGVIRADWPRVAASLESVIDLPFLERLLSAPPSAHIAQGPAAAPIAFNFASAPLEKRAGLLTSLVKAQVAGVLATANIDSISDQQPFREMGLDSLMALELRSKLRKALSLATPLPATLAFDYPTVAAVVRYLMTDIYGWGAPAVAANGRDDRPILDEIEAMSDEDVDRLFALRAGAS